jgi:hypothetical protein
VFEDAALILIDLVFDVVNVHRLEAALPDGRGNGALKKAGAVN